MNEPRLSSTAKKLNVFVSVLQGITILCCVAVVVLVLMNRPTAVYPGTLTPSEPENIHLFNVNFGLKYSTATDHIRWYFGLYMLLVGVCFAAILKGLGYIRRILSPMTRGEPFHADTAAHFRKLATASLIFGLAQNVAEAVQSPAFLFLGTAAAAEPFTYRVTWAPSVGFLLVYAILLLMSYIFSYGRELQILSDETL